MSPRLVRDAFGDPALLFELKHDGFRAVCYIENGECRLVSRNLNGLRQIIFHSSRSVLTGIAATSAEPAISPR